MSGVVLLAGLWLTHLGYLQWSSQADQQWHFYIASAAVSAYLCLLLLPQARRARWPLVGVYACWWGAIEFGQAAVCGWLEWGRLVQSELCLQALGPGVYAAAAGLTLAALLMMRGRHG